jgi:hypothetical protein
LKGVLQKLNQAAGIQLAKCKSILAVAYQQSTTKEAMVVIRPSTMYTFMLFSVLAHNASIRLDDPSSTPLADVHCLQSQLAESAILLSQQPC